MIIKAHQLKAARRHAQRMGAQLGDMLDSGHDRDGEVIEHLLQAWQRFIAQFQGPHGDVVAAQYVAEGYRAGVAGVNPDLNLELVVILP